MAVMGPVIITPLDGNDLFFRSLHGDEMMNGLFEYTVQVLTKAATISLKKTLGTLVTIAVEQSDGKKRFFTGHVARLTRVGVVGTYHLYRMTLRPWLWFLARTADCRIFQKRSIPEIVKKMFRKHADVSHFDEQLDRTYPPLPYVVQYRETDLNFVSRLLERAGISYHFVHENGKHTLVMTDGPGKRLEAPGYEKIQLLGPTEAGNTECLTSWLESQELVTQTYRLKDYDYTKRNTELKAASPASAADRTAAGELYDYPGLFQTLDEGNANATTRLEEAQSYFETIETGGPVRGVGVGNVFALAGKLAGDEKRQFVAVKAHYEVHGHSPESSGDRGDEHTFHCSLTVVDVKRDLRPPRVTPIPVVQGPQTAFVVGRDKEKPGDDEICTDELGRILVKFHWERLGADKPEDPERSSDDQDNKDAPCFLRVAQTWAGNGWGSVFIPRIGQEVIVEFLEGDPDRPIVTGCVYNNVNKPPYLDQGKKNQSGIRTRSTLKGTAKTYNEIRFDDTKGAEELFVQAEKNHTVNVKADRGVSVGGNESYSVNGTRTTTVTKADTVTLKNTHKMTVTDLVTEEFNKGHTLNIFAADQTIEIEKNKTEHVVLKYDLITDQELAVTQGQTKLNLVGNNATLKASDGSVTIDASTKLTLKVGESTITIEPAQIQVKSPTLILGGETSQIVIDASGVAITGMAQLKLNS